MTPTIGVALSGAAWRKSSHSGDEGACVELASLPGRVAIRDSKDPGGPVLLFPPTAWAAFATAPPAPQRH
ncbi:MULTISPECIES: DUF397 domain-containing protein [Micromonospora]|uniref:DUF397 domain-containing protein n=1 Tax=Micromonospora antibiotica TaxID=2807623 RepID=A0ABS3V7J5_9ACTN|nr:DUF397 domain-containing protein [Micromonospora antibiotica]MBO4161587.1 DUF397 domain-containing protein [Micromonospora antibiotica]